MRKNVNILKLQGLLSDLYKRANDKSDVLPFDRFIMDPEVQMWFHKLGTIQYDFKLKRLNIDTVYDVPIGILQDAAVRNNINKYSIKTKGIVIYKG